MLRFVIRLKVVMKMKCKKIALLLISICILLSGCVIQSGYEYPISLGDIPEYSGQPYVVLNGGEPEFEEQDLVTASFETYSEFDRFGRCGAAIACIGRDIMPTEERGSIGHIKPSGWQYAKYDFVDGKYLYNRCHLIGYQLTGENANEKNLITGTRYFNTEGMLPFENEVADYVKDTGNHVLYRVTPVFEDENLVASGVVMEAKSVEDGGKGVCFNVYVYNVQPGVEINYLTGESRLKEQEQEPDDGEVKEYILNTNSKKFHEPDCRNAKDIKEINREKFTGTRQELITRGYLPCGGCYP